MYQALIETVRDIARFLLIFTLIGGPLCLVWWLTYTAGMTFLPHENLRDRFLIAYPLAFLAMISVALFGMIFWHNWKKRSR